MPFASDPTRGFFIMVLIVLAIGGALALFAWRAPTLQGRRGLCAGQPRKQRCLLNNVFLVAACRLRLLSARSIRWCWMRLNGSKITVGPPLLCSDPSRRFSFALLVLVSVSGRGWAGSAVT